jgi:hypothetical protein
MHRDVGIDEHDDITGSSLRPCVPRFGRSGASRGVDDDDFVGWIGGSLDRPNAVVEGGRHVCRGYHDRKRRHGLEL